MKLEELAHKILLKLDPEFSHSVGKFAMKRKWFSSGEYKSVQKTEIFGIEVNNPLGLAAGFDKNGEISDQAVDYGFGWVEVGSVTYLGSVGNNKPRIFRKGKGSLLNRLGLSGNPAKQIIERLKRAKRPFSINIAKSAKNNIRGEQAIGDIVSSYKLVTELEKTNNLLYVAFNISCPNTKDGRVLEGQRELENLLSEIERNKGERPILLKLSPNLTYSGLREIVEASEDKVDGYIAGNTLQVYDEKHGRLGLSGGELKEKASDLLKYLDRLTSKKIIACGGISSGRDMIIAQIRGADYFQALSGFVYGKNSGVKFAHTLNLEFESLKRTNPVEK